MKLFKSGSHTAFHLKIMSQFEKVILVVLMLGLTSCADFLRGKPKTQEYVEIKNGGNMDCLKSISEDLSQFLNAEAGGEDLDRVVNCLNNTLTEFQNKVEGREQADAFNADEVYDIFTTFAPGVGLSREGAANLILLKSALLGGDSVRITKREIGYLKDYLIIVKNEAVKLIPYIKVYHMKKTDKLYSREFIAEAFSKMNAALKTLLAASQLANSNYSFSDFKTMLNNVLDMAEENQNLVEILIKINYVLNGYQLELNDVERGQYIDGLTEFLRLFSMYANAHGRFKLDEMNSFENNLLYIKDIVGLLESSLQYRKTGVISVNSLDHLMFAVSKSANLFTYPVRSSGLLAFYKSVFVRFFESGLNGSGLYFSGIKAIHFHNIKRELAIYQIYYRLIKKLIFTATPGASQNSYNVRELQRVMSQLNPADEQDVLQAFDANTQTQIVVVVAELKAEFLKTFPVLYFNNKLGTALSVDGWEQTLTDLSSALYTKMLSRWLMLGYGTNPYQITTLSTNHITKNSMYLWYSEFKSFFIDLKIFDPRTANGGVSFVKVADLFSRSGNGDDKMTFDELYENLGTLSTSGGALSDEIRADLTQAGCMLAEKDVFDVNFQKESCFMPAILANYQRYFSQLPHLVNYLNSISASQRASYISKILEVARVEEGNKGIKLESADISGVNSILKFIESLYINHDSDRNWALNEYEIRQAYPRFKNIATEFAYANSAEQLEEFKSWKGDAAGFGCFTKDDLIRESFIFLAFNGRTPEQSDMNSFPCFTGKPLFYFSGQVDRVGISGVFGTLKSILVP